MRRRAAPVALAALLAATPAGAHPHVFIQVGFALRFGVAGVEAVGVTWTFDEIFTGAVLPDYDPSGRGVLTADAARAIEADIFRNLAAQGYYTEVVADGSAVPLTDPRDFAVSLKHGVFVFSFEVPLPRPATRTVELMGWDPEYYIQFDQAVRPVTATGTIRPYRCERRRVSRETEITGPIDAEGVVCDIRAPR